MSLPGDLLPPGPDTIQKFQHDEQPVGSITKKHGEKKLIATTGLCDVIHYAPTSLCKL